MSILLIFVIFLSNLTRKSAPSVYSVKKAMQTYARQGTTLRAVLPFFPIHLLFVLDDHSWLQQAVPLRFSFVTMGCSLSLKRISTNVLHSMRIIILDGSLVLVIHRRLMDSSVLGNSRRLASKFCCIFLC